MTPEGNTIAKKEIADLLSKMGTTFLDIESLQTPLKDVFLNIKNNFIYTMTDALSKSEREASGLCIEFALDIDFNAFAVTHGANFDLVSVCVNTGAIFKIRKSIIDMLSIGELKFGLIGGKDLRAENFEGVATFLIDVCGKFLLEHEAVHALNSHSSLFANGRYMEYDSFNVGPISREQGLTRNTLEWSADNGASCQSLRFAFSFPDSQDFPEIWKALNLSKQQRIYIWSYALQAFVRLMHAACGGAYLPSLEESLTSGHPPLLVRIHTMLGVAWEYLEVRLHENPRDYFDSSIQGQLDAEMAWCHVHGVEDNLMYQILNPENLPLLDQYNDMYNRHWREFVRPLLIGKSFVKLPE